MMRRIGSAAALAAALTCACAVSPALAQPKQFDHVFVVMMENQSFDEIIGRNVIDPSGNPTGRWDTPFLTFTAPSISGFAFQYFGVTHPSLPNFSRRSAAISSACKMTIRAASRSLRQARDATWSTPITSSTASRTRV